MCCNMIETSSVPRKSSVIFVNRRKMFRNVRLAFGTILENLWKLSEAGRKSSGNRQNVILVRMFIQLEPLRGTYRGPVGHGIA